MAHTDDETVIHVSSNPNHRSIKTHRHDLPNGETVFAPHSHCPHCGNLVGEASKACVKCDGKFLAAVR